MNNERMPQGTTGRIIQISGPVIDVQFDRDSLPKIREMLYTDRGADRRTMEVVQHVSTSVVRCVMLGPSEGLCRDMPVCATGAPIRVPVGEAVSAGC